jgi:hypothetical protein
MLAVELPGKAPHLRLNFVKATDDEGSNFGSRGGSWSQHGFWKSLSVGNQKTVNVRATVAIHPNYPAGFILQPRHEKAEGTSAAHPSHTH